MNKREAFKRYIAFMAYINKGDLWITQLQQFFDYSKALVILLFLKQWFPHMGWKTATGIVILLAVAKVIFKIAGGWFYRHSGLWKVESEWNSKQDFVSAWNVETKKTIENIAEKVGAKSEFKEL